MAQAGPGSRAALCLRLLARVVGEVASHEHERGTRHKLRDYAVPGIIDCVVETGGCCPGVVVEVVVVGCGGGVWRVG